MNPTAQRGFDDDGAVIPVVFPGDAEATIDDSGNAHQRALEALQHGLILLWDEGHADSRHARLAALCRLFGVFQSDVEAATHAGIPVATLSRAVRRLRARIVSSVENAHQPNESSANAKVLSACRHR